MAAGGGLCYHPARFSSRPLSAPEPKETLVLRRSPTGGLPPGLCVAACAVLVAGCRLPGQGGAIPASLAASRQLSRQGVAALERRQFDQAESLLAKAVQSCPVDVDARCNYAEALWQRGQRQEAIGQLEEAIKLAGDDASLRVRMAEMQLAAGRIHLARQHAERALDLDPKKSAAWTVRARTARAVGDWRAALADYHRAMAGEPNDRAILLEVAEVYRELNQPERALATLHRLADTYAPGEEPQQVLYLQGLAYMALGRATDAAETLTLAAAREQPSPEVLYRLGQAELAAGRADEAAAAARRALQIDPEHAPSRELLGRLDVVRQTGSTVQR